MADESSATSGYFRHGTSNGIKVTRGTWFKVCKYYIAGYSVASILGAILTCGVCLYFAIKGIHSNKTLLTVSLFLGALFLVAWITYLYLIGVRGSLQELPKRLRVHGVVQALLYVTALGMIAKNRCEPSDPNIPADLKEWFNQATSPGSVIMTLVFCGPAMIACLAMSTYLTKEQAASADDA